MTAGRLLDHITHGPLSHEGLTVSVERGMGLPMGSPQWFAG
jgi:hypothetical protein